MSTNDVLLGLGLVIVSPSARSCWPGVCASRRSWSCCRSASWPDRHRDVHPDALLGALYQPFVSLSVGLILFEAGLRLSIRGIAGDVRRTVGLLVTLGVLVTWAGVWGATALLFDDLGDLVPLLIGAVLVVSGPTVVLPLLGFVRPARNVRSLLMWEGVLVDPVGALLGVIVFHAVLSAGSAQRSGGRARC